MTTRRALALATTLLATVGWVLPRDAFADRIGSPYRGPWEDLIGGGQDTPTQPDSGGGGEGGGEGGGGEGGGEGGGAPPVPGGGGGAGQPGGGGGAATTDPKITFEWWWEHSKDFYLARASDRGRVNRGGSYYWFGGGAKYPPREIVAVTEKQRVGSIFARLAKSLASDTSAGVRAEAAIALGRVGVVAAATEQKKEGLPDNLVVRELIAAVEKDTNAGVRTSAILALGMTRDKDASGYLLRHYDKYAADDKPYALVALGLSENRDEAMVRFLVEQLPKSSRAKDGASFAAVHAIGLLGPDAAAEVEKAGGIARMTKLLDGRGHDPLQTQLVRTLSLLQVARREVTRMVDSPSQDIQWMSILSLANYTRDEKDSEAAFKALSGKGAFDSGDSQNKSFAVLAMGRLASNLDPNSKLRDKIFKFLRAEALESRKNNYTRSCAALAMGIAGERSAIPTIAALLTDTTAQDHVIAAACVALGLLKATDHADSIRDNVLLKKRWEGHTRAYAALGIALMGDTTRLDELKKFSTDKSLTDKTTRMLPLVLAILGDRADVKALIHFFSKQWNKSEVVEASAAAFGLTWVRDQSAVDQLIALAEKNSDENIRGMAVIALGYVGARDSVNPLARCYENASHHNKFAGWDLLYEISLIL